MNSKIKSLENERMQKAFDFVGKALKEGSKPAKEYSSRIRKLPSMILNNGLAASVAFIFSKKKVELNNKTNKEEQNADNLIYNQLTEYAKEKLNFGETKDLMSFLVQSDSNVHRQLTIELLALLKWQKRFVEGCIDDEGKEISLT